MYLEQFKPEDLVFIHNFDVLSREHVHLPNLDDPKHFPISIMSQAALSRLRTTGYAKCLRERQTIPSMGTILVRCLEDMGVNVIYEKSLHTSEPTHDFNWPANPCQRPLGFSNLRPHQMATLYMAQPPTGRSKHGAYRWDSSVSYSTVFHHTFTSTNPTRNIDRHVPDDSTAVIVNSGADCMKLCEKETYCISWTFEHPICHLTNTVGVAIERQNVVSGVIPTRYVCN